MSSIIVKLKVKFQDYMRLHHLLTGISPKQIFEYLRDGLPIDWMTEDVPSHFADWVNSWKAQLYAEYGRIEQKALAIWASCPLPKDAAAATDRDARKALAEFFTRGDRREVSPVLFRMLNGDSYDDVIWKMVKPTTSAERPMCANDQ